MEFTNTQHYARMSTHILGQTIEICEKILSNSGSCQTHTAELQCRANK